MERYYDENFQETFSLWLLCELRTLKKIPKIQQIVGGDSEENGGLFIS